MPGIDFRELRRQVTMQEVLDLLGFQPTSHRGPQLRGPCPIPGCPSTSDRSFSVHLARQVYHCFACRSRGNPLDLWASIHGLPLYQAALDLCRTLNLAPARLDAPLIPSRCRSNRVASCAPLRNR